MLFTRATRITGRLDEVSARGWQLPHSSSILPQPWTEAFALFAIAHAFRTIGRDSKRDPQLLTMPCQQEADLPAEIHRSFASSAEKGASLHGPACLGARFATRQGISFA